METVLSWARDGGWSTGIVTTTRVSHATPAALFARTANRDWECDRDLYQGEDAPPGGVPPGVRTGDS